MPGEFLARVPEGGITGWLAGDGPPVLVLHGGPGLSDYTASLADELGDAFRVIRYQQRGLAPSTASGPFDVGRHVADAIAVLDTAGVGPAYVVGHSWGGHLAMHLAVRHPGRVLGLVIDSVAHSGPTFFFIGLFLGVVAAVATVYTRFKRYL